jgi:hypothetical protein
MSDKLSLTPRQKEQVLSVLRMGCRRKTAIDFAGVDVAELDAEMQRDAAFARDVLQAEAVAEIQHMSRVQSAAKDDRNWRASAWWIERQRQDTATTDASPTLQHVVELVERLAEVIVTVLVDEELRHALLERLLAAVKAEHGALRDVAISESPVHTLLTEASPS